MLGIVCSIESAGLTTGSDKEPSRLSINRWLRFYLRPLRLAHETAFTIELRTMDRSEGGKFETRASPVENSDTALFAKIGQTPKDAGALFDVMLSGKDLTFALAYKTEQLMEFYLQNDDEFKQLSEETYKHFIGLETKYREARLQRVRSG